MNKLGFCDETTRALAEVKTVILRKKFGENQSFEIVDTAEAFADILKDEQWGSESCVEEADSLCEFLEKCSKPFSWRKTNSWSYKFINLDDVSDIFESLDKIQGIQNRQNYAKVNPEDDLFY